jgi:uncharacterized protein (DUF2147 family)
MKHCKSLLAFFFALVYMPIAMAASPAGNWTTIDDKTGKKRAVVRINVSGDKLTGTILKVYKQAGDTGKCKKCPGSFKNKPVQGLRFVWGMKRTGPNSWGGGRIIDPKNGKIYRCKITQKGNKLYVRGYIGISLLGRTQTWVR